MRMRTAGRSPRMRRGGLARLSPLGAFGVVAATVLIVAAGVSAGLAAASPKAASLRLGYTCAFPSASRAVSTLVTATFPAAGTAGQPIQPTGTRITVTLPRAAVADLVGPNAAPGRPEAAAVRLTASLGTEATEGTRSLAVIWRDLRSPAAAVPRRGPLTLTASGSAPSVTAAAAGNVTVSAARLSLLFATGTISVGPNRPSGTPKSSSGAPGRPASIRAECVPRPGQDTTLATIAVTGPAPARVHTPRRDNPAECLPFPHNLSLNPRFPLPSPIPGATEIHHAERGCSYAAGYTNANKLHEAALVGPGLTDLHLGVTTFLKASNKFTYLQQRVPGQLEYHGRPELPPARATLLGFGFTPVSATLQISEIGTLNAALISCAPAKKCPNPPPKTEALFFGRVSLRIYNVDINGVPLNVGTHCQTVHPFNMALVGVPPTYSVLTLSGVLTGTVTVPKFSGCSDGTDNLDPIFDATVSGPGNFVKINQAPFCTPHVTGAPGCPPEIAKPVH